MMFIIPVSLDLHGQFNYFGIPHCSASLWICWHPNWSLKQDDNSLLTKTKVCKRHLPQKDYMKYPHNEWLRCIWTFWSSNALDDWDLVQKCFFISTWSQTSAPCLNPCPHFFWSHWAEITSFFGILISRVLCFCLPMCILKHCYKGLQERWETICVQMDAMCSRE